METGKLFHLLDRTDSTNNYAMAQVHAGLALPGMAWFTREQFAGKGQRGKTWNSAAGENILLSIAWQPDEACKVSPFLLSARVALICRAFVEKYLKEPVQIKWPNDIYWDDRKAGGILIENKLHGSNWAWAVIGIGMNVNQVQFPENLVNPVSFRQVTGMQYDPTELARALHQDLLKELSLVTEDSDKVMKEYNEHLYAKGGQVKIKKGSLVFTTVITGVDQRGKLLTRDALEREFEVGEVELILK